MEGIELNNNKKISILFIHGWGHSKERYFDLCDRLEEYNCTAVDLPGFGEKSYSDNVKNIEKEHIQYIKQLLKENHFDYAIAHSWGARVLLSALENEPILNNIRCIVLNPIYDKNFVFHHCHKLVNKTKVFLKMLSKIPHKMSTFIIKLLSLVTINRWKHIDDLVVKDIRRANPNVAEEILQIITHTTFRTDKEKVPNDIYLIYSDRDDAVSSNCFHTLKKDLNAKAHVFPKIGHTAVLENIDGLSEQIRLIINGHI